MGVATEHLGHRSSKLFSPLLLTRFPSLTLQTPPGLLLPAMGPLEHPEGNRVPQPRAGNAIRSSECPVDSAQLLSG